MIDSYTGISFAPGATIRAQFFKYKIRKVLNGYVLMQDDEELVFDSKQTLIKHLEMVLE